jgi:hypothetical protein
MTMIFTLLGLTAIFAVNYGMQWLPMLAPNRAEWLDRFLFSAWALSFPAIFFIEYAWFRPDDTQKAALEHMRHLQGLGRDFWLAVTVVLAGALLGKWG